MNSAPVRLGASLAGSLAVCMAVLVALSGCAMSDADSSAPSAAPEVVDLTFDYLHESGEGFIDQTLTITNSGGAAGAPDLDIAPLDADGEEVPDIEVITAFGSDEGNQVVPAYTEVTDVLKFKGARAADVVDVEVTVADPGTLEDDVPPANDLQVKRYDIDGKSGNDNTVGSVLLVNTYDKPIRVMIVGFEFADSEPGETTHFKQVSPLAGPLDLEPGERVRERVEDKYRTRFFGSVRAYLVR